MAKSISWTQKAQQERKEILSYWKNRNQSTAYPKKLNQLFRAATQLIARHPNIGLLTDYDNVRVRVVRDYLIFYKEDKLSIIILTVWDSRQDPDGLNITL